MHTLVQGSVLKKYTTWPSPEAFVLLERAGQPPPPTPRLQVMQLDRQFRWEILNFTAREKYNTLQATIEPKNSEQNALDPRGYQTKDPKNERVPSSKEGETLRGQHNTTPAKFSRWQCVH